MRVVRQYFRKK